MLKCECTLIVQIYKIYNIMNNERSYIDIRQVLSRGEEIVPDCLCSILLNKFVHIYNYLQLRPHHPSNIVVFAIELRAVLFRKLPMLPTPSTTPPIIVVIEETEAIDTGRDNAGR